MALGSIACGRIGFDRAQPSAEPDGTVVPACGNSVVDVGEQCDGTKLAGASCTDFGFSPTDDLACNDSCRFDASACHLGADCRGRWSFNEGSGSAVLDQSQYNNDGILEAVNPELVWADSGLGGGAHFTNSGEEVTIEVDPSLLLDEEMSFELWVKFDALNDYSYAMNNDLFYVLFRGGGFRDDPLFFSYRTTEITSAGDSSWSYYVAASSSSQMLPGRWYYIVGVKSQTHMSLYVNGRLEKENWCLSDRTIDGSMMGDLILGGSGFRGMIDEVTVWSRLLTADEIAKRWHRERCLMQPALCDAKCGNNILDSGEQCDSLDLNAKNCTDVGSFAGGELSCSSDCTFDTTSCFTTSSALATWELNEGMGEVVGDSSSGYQLHGSLQGMDPVTSWVAGVDGTALYFDSGTGLVVVPDHESLHLTDSLTVELWVKFETLDQDNLILLVSNTNFAIAFRGAFAGNRMYFLHHIDGEESPRDSAWNGWTGVRAVTQMATDTWYHVAVVKSGDMLSIYINGIKERELDGFVVDGVQPPHTPTLGDVTDLYMGQNGFNGTIDQPTVFSRALSGDEIRERFLKRP